MTPAQIKTRLIKSIHSLLSTLINNMSPFNNLTYFILPPEISFLVSPSVTFWSGTSKTLVVAFKVALLVIRIKIYSVFHVTPSLSVLFHWYMIKSIIQIPANRHLEPALHALHNAVGMLLSLCSLLSSLTSFRTYKGIFHPFSTSWNPT